MKLGHAEEKVRRADREEEAGRQDGHRGQHRLCRPREVGPAHHWTISNLISARPGDRSGCRERVRRREEEGTRKERQEDLKGVQDICFASFGNVFWAFFSANPAIVCMSDPNAWNNALKHAATKTITKVRVDNSPRTAEDMKKAVCHPNRRAACCLPTGSAAADAM
eukprot:942346-Rhodomonas_salina.1